MLKVVSAIVLALGIVILVVLVALGGVVKTTIHDTVINRLKYKLPPGYKNDPNYEECRRSTSATFDQEYYLWNLTNPNEFLNGTKPNFNLTGPFSYVLWYCDYGHVINDETGYLTYRTRYEGYRFIREDSSDDDSVLITNINPAYLGISQLTNDEHLPLAFSGAAMLGIIQKLQSPETLTLLWMSSTPLVLKGMNSAIINSVNLKMAAGLSALAPDAATFFDASFIVNGVEGFVHYVQRTNASADMNISTSAQEQIFADMKSAAALAGLAKLNGSSISAQYGITVDQGNYLSSYTAYLLAALLPSATKTVYGQWANGTSTSSYQSGWEAGLPTPTGISLHDVSALFDPSGVCSLTNSSGINVWMKLMAGAKLADLCLGVFSMSDSQEQMLFVWLNNYASTVVSQILLGQFGITDWNDFAYAQWGHLAAGGSVQALAGLDYAPEAGAAGCIFTTEEAKLLLNGTNALFNVTNWQKFLGLVLVHDVETIQAIWPPLDVTRLGNFWSSYIQGIVVPKITTPKLNEIFAQGGSLVTTRTAREWLMTGKDPLLAALGKNPDVSFVGNLTRTKAEADLRNSTYYRIYTGKNDLHWSLMPFNEGVNLTFWNGTELITGYNGTQFLPFGDLDADVMEYPLVLFHKLVNRTIPFQMKGRDTWEGVNVRYLTITDDALASASVNPHNSLYYAQFGGAINKSSNPPGLPIFLTTPDFLSADPYMTENITWNDQVFTGYDAKDPLSRHRHSIFILAEPLLGSALWGNLPIQVNMKYGPTGLFPNINHGFAPIYWNAIGDKAEQHDLDVIKNSLYTGQTAWKVLIGVGVGVGTVMIVAGIVGLVIYRKQKGLKLPSSP